jgi:cell shape-determining protein MreC
MEVSHHTLGRTQQKMNSEEDEYPILSRVISIYLDILADHGTVDRGSNDHGSTDRGTIDRGTIDRES